VETKRMDPNVDAELFHRMMSGRDTQARRAGLKYYPRFTRMLSSYVKFKLGHRENEWQDVLQIVLTNAFEARNQAPRDGVGLRRWLYVIARAVCFNTVTRGHAVEPLPEIEPASRRPGPETLVHLADQRVRIRAALDQLPPFLARLLELRYLDDRCVDQIAESVGEQTRVVRRHLDAGRVQLAWELNGHDATRRSSRN